MGSYDLACREALEDLERRMLWRHLVLEMRVRRASWGDARVVGVTAAG
jgi:hypothetical protein